ncbi:hypothetical protein KAR91_55790 [Candidatus Pacearchaeota archaeon]|nr:hypothetical protein [Candidatus Pacearchaeota archaeon]
MYFTNEELDQYIKVIKLDQKEYLKSTVPQIIQSLRKNPNNYLAFGVYWYHVKKVIQGYTSGEDWFYGDFHDQLIMETSDHGDDFRNAVAALVYADSTDYFSSSSHTYTWKGDPRVYILEDNDFLDQGITEIATEGVRSGEIAMETVKIDFNSALGKPIGVLTEQIQEFSYKSDMKTSERRKLATDTEKAKSLIDSLPERIASAETLEQTGAMDKEVMGRMMDLRYISEGDNSLPDDDPLKSKASDLEVKLNKIWQQVTERSEQIEIKATDGKAAKSPIKIEGKLNKGLKDYFTKNGFPKIGTEFENKGHIVKLKEVNLRDNIADVKMSFEKDGVEKEFRLIGIPTLDTAIEKP